MSRNRQELPKSRSEASAKTHATIASYFWQRKTSVTRLQTSRCHFPVPLLMRPAAAIVSLAVFIGVITSVALFALSRAPEPQPQPKVKLAVLVVFDQLRGDYLEYWRPLFGRNGFARLQRDGAWFTHCHYPYGTTTTGPGHASMLTGAAAESHGINNNNWIESGKVVYCAGHDRYELVPPAPKFLPNPADVKEKKTNTPKEIGTPERLLSETVADVLKEDARQVEGVRAVAQGSLRDPAHR